MPHRESSRRRGPARAPGDLETLRAFLNTDADEDALGSVASAQSWLTARGLLPADTELTENDRLRLLRVRGELRALADRPRNTPPGGEVVARLAEALGELRYGLRLGTDGLPRFEPVSEGLGFALGALMEVLARSTERWPRIKLCAACGRAFYDTSRSRVAKWCSRRCGDRIRGRALRRRKKYRGAPHRR